MSDDLVNRLREGATWDDDIAAADRIEELEKQNASLEAKLAMAVEALEYIKETLSLYSAKEALAKIKGEQP